jgi:hypothetical protein
VTSPTYRIGPLALELTIPDSELRSDIDHAWGAFRGVPPGVPVKLSVALREEAATPAARTMPRPVRLPSGETLLAGDGWQARLAADGLHAVMEQRPERFPLETTVKILLARALNKSGGLLLRACAVAHGGGAAVFVAGAQGGKSTLAKVAAIGGVSVLADEWVAVFPISGEWWAYGTPWEQGAAWGAPLKAIGSLSFGESPQVDVVPPESLRGLLLANVLLPDDEAATRTAAERAADEVLAKANTVKLTFDAHARVSVALQSLCG